MRSATWATSLLLICLAPACVESGDVTERLALSEAALSAVCVAPPEQPPEDAWICGMGRLVECTGPAGTSVEAIYAPLETGESCADVTLAATATGPFGLGPHAVEVERLVGGVATDVLCSSLLTVVDTTPPVVTPAVVELVADGGLHSVSPEDCAEVSDRCDEGATAAFTFLRSDEPAEGASLDCDEARLPGRSDPGGNGRVYTLGVRASDNWGNTTDTICRVVVPSAEGQAVDSGTALEIEAGACEIS